MEAKAKGGLIYLKFKYNPDLVNKIRQIMGRVYYPDKKMWSVPDTDFIRKKLKAIGFNIMEENSNTNVKVIIPKKAYPFQAEGIRAMVKNKRILLADDMGLGKTMQTINAIRNLKGYPVLVVCPATLKFNWAIEIKKWDARPTVIISGTKNDWFPEAAYYIINYDILEKNLNVLSKIKFKTLVLDEAHYIKSSKSKRTKAILKLNKDIKFENVFALTGTPILNKPIEIFNTLNLLRPDVYKSRWYFARKFCGLRHNGFGWTMDGATNTDELNKLLQVTVMIRRTKKDVLKDLPAKVRTIIPVEISNQREYKRAFENFYEWLESKGQMVPTGAETLVKIEKLKQLAVKGKMKQIANWINDFLETGQKLVVFATHKFVIDYLSNTYEGAVVIDGSTSKEDRQKNIEAFQNDPKTRLIIGNIKAMGVGVTLTASSTTLFIELGWTPAEHDQAEDRIHRIGQKESVNIYYMVAKDTIEEDIIELIDKKRDIVSRIIDGERVKFDTLSELLQRVKSKKKMRKM